MSGRRVSLLRNALVATCAVMALVLLASFYGVVSGAVDRSARQRYAIGEGVAPASLGAVAAVRAAARPVALLARSGN